MSLSIPCVCFKFSKLVAALMIYISILERQAKFGDALEILSGKLGSLLQIEVDKLRMQVVSIVFFLLCYGLTFEVISFMSCMVLMNERG